MEPAHWWKLLPQPYDKNPNVVLSVVPTSAVSRVRKLGKYELGIMECTNGKVFGLQVLDRSLHLYGQHQDVFDEAGIEMVQPQHIGLVSEIKQDLLVKDLVPLVFLRDSMWHPYLNLRHYFYRVTKREDNVN